MKFEVLKRSNLKRNILIGLGIVLILVAIILTFTKARYRVTESIPLVNGTINYDLADLNVVAVYIQNGNDYSKSNTIPSSGYTFNEETSYCTVNGEEDTSITVSYDASTQSLSVSPLTKKGTKCYLYFDTVKSLKDVILADRTIQTRTFPTSNGTSIVGSNGQGDIYQAEDNDGITYYFAGNPTDNWVYFGDFYWRVIRINGDGTFRIIYSGDESAQTAGTGTQIGTSAFNSSIDVSYYVGLKYSNYHHGTTTNSTILSVLNTWYSNNLLSYDDKIDINAGFCGDREMETGYNWSATPSDSIYYKAHERLGSNNTMNPTFKCIDNNDLYTISSSNNGNKSLQYPIGLITADEVIYAGLPMDWSGASDNYLYTGQFYWTMTPYGFNSIAQVFPIWSSGSLGGNFLRSYSVNMEFGVRPVINLRDDITISSGDGTSSNPYVIS